MLRVLGGDLRRLRCMLTCSVVMLLVVVGAVPGCAGTSLRRGVPSVVVVKFAKVAKTAAVFGVQGLGCWSAPLGNVLIESLVLGHQLRVR